MGYIFRYSTNETRYLDPAILINKINGITTDTPQQTQDSIYMISKKLNKPIREISFEDIKTKIDRLNYNDNFNKMLLLNKDYLDAILYLIADDALKVDEYEKIIKAESAEERKFLLISMLKKVDSKSSIFNTFLAHLPIKNYFRSSLSHTIAYEKITLNDVPRSTTALIGLPYTFPNVSEETVMKELKSLGNTTFIGNPSIGVGFDSGKATQKLLGFNSNQRAGVKQSISKEEFNKNLGIISNIESWLETGRRTSKTIYYTQNLIKFEVSVTKQKLCKQDGEPIDYYILERRRKETINGNLIIEGAYNPDATYYIKNSNGAYEVISISEGNYFSYSDPLYQYRPNDYKIPCIDSFGPNFSRISIEKFINIIDENFNESRIYNERNKEKYKQELIEKIEANVDLLEDSLYKPIIIDLLKNYIEWLFTDDFYVDNEKSIEFPYYISSECEAYIRPASTVLKTLEISKKVVDVYNTKDISRMKKFTF